VIRRFTGRGLFVPADVVDNHSQGNLDSFTPVRSTCCFSFTLQAVVSNAVPDLAAVIAVLVLDEFEESADLPGKAGFWLVEAVNAARVLSLAAAGSGQQTVLVKFPVKIPLADTEDSGRVSTVTVAGLERQPDMLPLRLFQSQQRSTVR